MIDYTCQRSVATVWVCDCFQGLFSSLHPLLNLVALIPISAQIVLQRAKQQSQRPQARIASPRYVNLMTQREHCHETNWWALLPRWYGICSSLTVTTLHFISHFLHLFWFVPWAVRTSKELWRHAQSTPLLPASRCWSGGSYDRDLN